MKNDREVFFMDKLLQIFSNIDFAGTAVAVTGVVGIIISVIIITRIIIIVKGFFKKNKKADKIYLFKDIEFYFYNKNHRDIITHPRISKELCWYVNDFGGIDLNFASCIEYDNRLDAKG